MEPKRRLPVLKSTGDDDDAPPRPPWQWVGFGTVAILAVWMPLAAAAVALVGGGARAIEAAAHLLALGVAALAGGFVVGRWGAAGIGVRQAALSGLAATFLAAVASWTPFGLALAVVAVPMAALGGARGLRRRARAP